MSGTEPQPTATNEDPADAAPEQVDEQVAANVRMLREQAGLSLAAFAEKVAEFGWQCAPQTLHRIETRRRKVTAGEADLLARALGTTLTQLTWPDEASNTVNFINMFTGRADGAYERIAGATGQLLFARAHLERAVASARARGIDDQEHVREALTEAVAALENATPERAVETGRQDYADNYPEGAPDAES